MLGFLLLPHRQGDRRGRRARNPQRRRRVDVRQRCLRPLLERPRDWFLGKNMFVEMPDLAAHWKDILRTVAENRETYIDRTYHGLLSLPRRGEEWA